MPFPRTRPEARRETVEKLRGERDLGHEDQALASSFKSRRDGLEINLRLAGARYAFEQGHRERLCRHAIGQKPCGVFLRGFKGWSGESRIARKRRRLGRQGGCVKRALVG